MMHLVRSRENMRNGIFIMGAFVMMLFAGCEKVITLDLENAAPVVVIDGGVSDQVETQQVKISKTYNFTESNKFNGIAGATVVLTSSDGMRVAYTTGTTVGIYQAPFKFRGKPGIKYTLDVNLEGKQYTASSIMPARVNLDSLTFKDFSFFGTTNTYVAVNYVDPKGIQNQYRSILKAKGKIEEDMVNEDRFDDGNKVSNVIFYELKDLVAGDAIDVEFQCIDRNVYKYFFSLKQSSGGGGPPVAPSNPPSNFNNDALGVFSAYTSSKRTVVLK